MGKESDISGAARAESEKIFWDYRFQGSRALKLSNEKNYEQYFLSYPHFRYILDFFGMIKGRKILDLGCGSGWISTYFARSEADVYCCDVSPKAIEVTREMARVNSVRLDADVMAAEKLKYQDEFFDFVFGNAVLHHTELPDARDEIYRCLKRGGKAAFIEPLVYNPLLKLYRLLSKHAHSPGEHPLTYEEVHAFGEPFAEFSFEEFQLFILPTAFRRRFKPYLERLDDVFLGVSPSFKKYCSIVVVRVMK